MDHLLLNLNPIELASLKQAFLLYSNNTLTIPTTEFALILKSLNIATHPNHIQFIINSVKPNGKQLIDFNAFVSVMVRYIPTPHLEPCPDPNELEPIHSTVSYGAQDEKHTSFQGEEELMQCFRAFDLNNDNRISQSELEQVMISLGENLSAWEIKAMMEEADTNGDGYIDFQEFKQLVVL